MMSKITSDALDAIILEEQTHMTLADLCRACAVHAELIMDMVDEGLLEPVGGNPRTWRFTGTHLRRARVALRLQSDLAINLAGTALVMQLLDEIAELRSRLRALEDEPET